MRAHHILFAFLAAASAPAAEQIHLQWLGSPDAGVGHYRVHYGREPGHYTASVAVPKSSSATIEVPDAGPFYLVVTAVGTNQLESVFSNEVRWPVPESGEEPPGPPTIDGKTFVKLTPVIAKSVDGGPWQEEALAPSYRPATNSQEFFRGLRIDKVVTP